MNEVLQHFHLQLVSLYTSADLWLNSLCAFNLLIFSGDFTHTCSTKKRSRRSADILQEEVRAAQVSQNPRPLPWIPHPSGDSQIVLHKLLPDAADPLRWNRFICTTYVKIQHTAQLAEGLALELGEVNLNAPNAAPHSADVAQTHWRRADQLWNEPQRSQAFARAAHSLAENLPPSVSTCSSHREVSQSSA